MTADRHEPGLVTTPGQIEALSNPIRHRILRYAGHPVTVGELAEQFGVPKTRLYYHVNLLVEVGMLEQVDERKSGARTERIYLRTARDFRLGPDLVETMGGARNAAEAAAAVLFDPARSEVEDLLVRSLTGDKMVAHLGRLVVRLSADRAQEFVARMDRLVSDLREAGDEREGSVAFALTAALVPTELEDDR